jgi:hypothetical protein
MDAQPAINGEQAGVEGYVVGGEAAVGRALPGCCRARKTCHQGGVNIAAYPLSRFGG